MVVAWDLTKRQSMRFSPDVLTENLSLDDKVSDLVWIDTVASIGASSQWNPLGATYSRHYAT